MLIFKWRICRSQLSGEYVKYIYFCGKFIQKKEIEKKNENIGLLIKSTVMPDRIH